MELIGGAIQTLPGQARCRVVLTNPLMASSLEHSPVFIRLHAARRQFTSSSARRSVQDGKWRDASCPWSADAHKLSPAVPLDRGQVRISQVATLLQNCDVNQDIQMITISAQKHDVRLCACHSFVGKLQGPGGGSLQSLGRGSCAYERPGLADQRHSPARGRADSITDALVPQGGASSAASQIQDPKGQQANHPQRGVLCPTL